MKKLVVFLCAVTMVIGMGGMAHATLIDLSDATGQMIHDDVNDKYWIWDLLMFNYMAFGQQETAIAGLDYFGKDDWVMASTVQVAELRVGLAEYTHLYADILGPTLLNDGYGRYNVWYGRTSASSVASFHNLVGIRHDTYPNIWEEFHPSNPHNVHDDGSYGSFGAWVVSDAVTLSLNQSAYSF